MPLLRKDIKIGFLAGGALLAIGIGYVIVLSLAGGPDQATANGQDQPDAPDPLGAPIDAANFDAGDWDTGASTTTTGGDEWGEPFVSVTPGPGDPPPVVPTRDDFIADEPVAADLNGPADIDFPLAVAASADITTPDLASGATQHTIASGDSFSSLALRYYGDANLFGAIQRANPGVDSGRLKIGQVVVIPDRTAAATISETPLPSPGGTHTVASGETLSKIASRRLGRANLWEQIYSINRDVIGDDPANLKVGMVLKLPG